MDDCVCPLRSEIAGPKFAMVSVDLEWKLIRRVPKLGSQPRSSGTTWHFSRG